MRIPLLPRVFGAGILARVDFMQVEILYGFGLCRSIFYMVFGLCRSIFYMVFGMGRSRLASEGL